MTVRVIEQFAATHILLVILAIVIILLLFATGGRFTRNPLQWLLRTIFRDIIYQFVRAVFRSIGLR